MSKYGAKQVVCDGIRFDSRKEARRYSMLKLMEKAGEISNLRLQQPYELIPPQYEEVALTEKYKRGEKAGQYKRKRVCVEQSVKYIADFVYEKNGETVVEDTKGAKTKDYIIKRKLMLHVHGVKIREV